MALGDIKVAVMVAAMAGVAMGVASGQAVGVEVAVLRLPRAMGEPRGGKQCSKRGLCTPTSARPNADFGGVD